MPAETDIGRGEASREKLSAELVTLHGHIAANAMTLGAIISHLRARTHLLFIILLTLPFLTPLPLPGISTPFGAVIALSSLMLALGQKPWLPSWLQRKQVPAGLFLKILTVAVRIVGWLERFLRPRWSWLFASKYLVSAHVLLIFVAALVLLLPLPIPLTNTFPAWVILLAAGGLLEKDGGSVALSYAVFLLGALYFAFLGEVLTKLIQSFWAAF